MNIQYVYTIQIILTTNEKIEKLRLKNVCFHWIFKKLKFFDDNFFVRKFFYKSKSKRVYEFDFDIFDVDDFIRDDRINSIVFQFNFNENENLNDLINVVEFKNKNVITKIRKKKLLNLSNEIFRNSNMWKSK